MKIGIIGVGNVGAALAAHFNKSQNSVRIGNSRGPETLADLSLQTGAEPITVLEAAKGVDLLFHRPPNAKPEESVALARVLWEN